MHLFPQKTSLIFRVIFVTSLILILAISFNVYWNTALHEGKIERVTQEKAKIISEFLENNVIRAMEKGRHFEIHRVLKNYAGYRGIWKINVVRPDGTIIASTLEEELNKKVENVDFYFKNRYFEKEESIRDNRGKQQREAIFYYINPILNKPECFQCHDKKHRIIGSLVIADSMKETHELISKV